MAISKIKIIFAYSIFSILIVGCKEKPNQQNKDEQLIIEDAHIQKDQGYTTLSKSQMETIAMTFGRIEKKELGGRLRMNGVLKVPNTFKAKATPLVGGIINELLVEVGDHVQKGQVIAQISNTQFMQLQEEYLSIHSRIEFAQQELDRQRELHEENVGARKNLQSATMELNTLKTRKASLAQQLNMMGIQPSSLSNENLRSTLSVRSPIRGTVTEALAMVGSYVDASSSIVEIVENSALHLDLEVFEKDIPFLKNGQKVDFVLTNNPDRHYEARIYNIGSSFKSGSKSIAVHTEVLGDKSGLIDGMNVTATIHSDGVLSWAVPSEAIVNYENKNFIFIIDQAQTKNRAEAITFKRVEVLVGSSDFGFTAITPLVDIPEDSELAVKGSFFVNASLNTNEDHDH